MYERVCIHICIYVSIYWDSVSLSLSLSLYPSLPQYTSPNGSSANIVNTLGSATGIVHSVCAKYHA